MRAEEMPVEFATYYFTLLVMLASVLAAATCFSAYLVSRSRAMILSFGGFLCYFLDVAFMLQDSIAAVVLGGNAGADAGYLLMRSVATILIGDACLTFFWLLVCDFVGERRRGLMAVPPIAFLLLSLGLLMGADTPEGRFWFYSLRMIYVFWMLGFGLFRYLACRDETERTRMARGRVVFVVVAVLAALVVAEDALLFLVLRTDGFMLGPSSSPPSATTRRTCFSSPAPFWPSATPFARWPCASRSRRPTKATSAPRASATTCSFTHGATA